MSTDTAGIYRPPFVTEAEQCRRHYRACVTYSREALAAGRLCEALDHVNAAQAWADQARAAETAEAEEADYWLLVAHEVVSA